MNPRLFRARIPLTHKIIGLCTAALFILSGCEVVAQPQPTQVPTIPAAVPTITMAPTATTAPTDAPTAIVQPTASPTAVNAAAFPDPAGFDWVPVVSGLDNPVDIQNAGDGSGRLFIVEKPGRIVIEKDGQVLPTPFLDITAKVKSDGSEQGLLGLAFHPQYSQAGTFFVNYIDQNGNTVIARFHVSASDPNQADPASETDLIHVDQPFANHNGGSMVFGPDGYLYMGLGDGGSGGDPLRNGQNTNTMLGKILRIDVNKDPYGIPPDNPFAQGGGLAEIWAFGLRNPWRFSFDKATGDMFIADVGQDNWEEIDYVPAGTPGGLNFGWSYFEGNHAFNDTPPANAKITMPVAEYPHSKSCSVTGGYVYRGASMTAWQGVYIYGDFCSGIIWGLIHPNGNDWQNKVLFTTSAMISTFGVDEAGELYMAGLGTSGSIFKLAPKP